MWLAPGDHEIWRIDINIHPKAAFLQEGSPKEPIVYWLDVAVKTDNNKARILAETLDEATGKLLENNKSPSRRTGELDHVAPIRGVDRDVGPHSELDVRVDVRSKRVRSKRDGSKRDRS